MTEENAVKKDYQFVRGNLMLSPYVKGGLFKEEALYILYNRLRSEDLWSVVFHENTEMSLLEFMNFFSHGNCSLQILSIVNNDTVVDFAGMAWLTDMAVCQNVLTRASGSFGFFKEYQKPMYTDQFSDMILEFWFEQMKIDTLIGMTPEPNRSALLYIKRIGFKEVARLPQYTTYKNEVVTGVVTMMTKDDYQQLAGG